MANLTEEQLAAARSLVSDSLVWDMTLPYIHPTYTQPEMLPLFSEAGFDVVSLTVAGADFSFDQTMKSIAWTKRMIADNSDKYRQVCSVADIQQARSDGVLALLFNLQNTTPLIESTDMVHLYYDLGVRHMLMAYNSKNAVGDGCAERTDAGLSRFGVSVVKEMNRVGMLVDGSHTGKRTTMDAMEVSTAPFIFSHSNAKAVFDHYRNIDDEQIKACAQTGGVIGINGLGSFSNDAAASSETIFKHIDHIANLMGVDHVGIALDYVHDLDGFWQWVEDNPDAWPENPANKGNIRSRFSTPEQIVEVTGLMLNNGYAADDIQKILGGNFQRVGQEVWR